MMSQEVLVQQPLAALGLLLVVGRLRMQGVGGARHQRINIGRRVDLVMRDGSRRVLSSPHDRGITTTTLTTTRALRHLLGIRTRTSTTVAVAIEEAPTTETIHRVETALPMTMAQETRLIATKTTTETTVAHMVEGMDTATIPYGDESFHDGRERGSSRRNDRYDEDEYEDRGSRGYRTLSIYRVRSF